MDEFFSRGGIPWCIRQFWQICEENTLNNEVWPKGVPLLSSSIVTDFWRKNVQYWGSTKGGTLAVIDNLARLWVKKRSKIYLSSTKNGVGMRFSAENGYKWFVLKMLRKTVLFAIITVLENFEENSRKRKFHNIQWNCG